MTGLFEQHVTRGLSDITERSAVTCKTCLNIIAKSDAYAEARR